MLRAENWKHRISVLMDEPDITEIENAYVAAGQWPSCVIGELRALVGVRNREHPFDPALLRLGTAFDKDMEAANASACRGDGRLMHLLGRAYTTISEIEEYVNKRIAEGEDPKQVLL